MGASLRRTGFEIGAAAAAMFGFAELSGMNARKLQNQATILGVNVEELQRYGYAAKVAAGINEDEFNGSLNGLADTMDRFRHGDPLAAQAILNLSRSTEQRAKILSTLGDKTKTSLDLFKQVVPLFSKMDDAVAKSRLARNIFGTDKIVPFLNTPGKELDKLLNEAPIRSAQQIAAAAKMQQQYEKLTANFKRFFFEVGFFLQRTLAPYLEKLQVWIAHNQKLIDMNIGEAIKALGDAFTYAVEAGKWLFEQMESFNHMLGGTRASVHLLIGAFLAYKGVTLAAGFVNALSLISTAIGVTMPELVALGAIVHDIWAALNGNFEDTWVYKLVHSDGFVKLMNMIPGDVLGKGGDMMHVTPSPLMGSGFQEQANAVMKTIEHNYQPTVNIYAVPGASASDMGKQFESSMERDYEKAQAKMNALLNRTY